ncbi:diol dehydratase small subunit [Caloramator sp. E03]|uniref:diol dehydratase small subunit n=1 Tax=Caloramator sp. E03 TaxID=2576307 RepID=UPI0011107381|nr:diol dehydratase small subunit [Caloramator sp. E03]QCX34509.1 diol dehydratase small subunit [Caloramator sp. E03]
MDNTLIEEIVNEVLKSINKVQREDKRQNYCNSVNEKLGVKDYPLIQKRKDLIKTKTGKNIDDINIENVISGKISPDDIKITQDVLLYQAQIADSVGRTQFAKNLRRAAELTAVPDERVLEIYNALRPYRSTKEELIAIADELENKYNAKLNAAHVREAAEVYEKRGRLKV